MDIWFYTLNHESECKVELSTSKQECIKPGVVALVMSAQETAGGDSVQIWGQLDLFSEFYTSKGYTEKDTSQ